MGMRTWMALGLAIALGVGIWGCAKKEEVKPTEEEMKIIGTVSLIGAPSSEGVEVGIEALGISATTDAKGAFVLSGVTEGIWEITFYKPGYPKKKISVTVEPGQKTVNIGEIKMEPGGRISGIVTLEGAESFKDVLVALKTAGGTDVATTKTNEEGKFSFEELEPGDYVILAQMSGYEEKREEVSVESGKEAAIELTLPKIKEKFVFVDLRPYANYGRNIHGDPNNSLDLPIGVNTAPQGIPFNIIDPDKNNGNMTLQIYGTNVSAAPKSIEGIKVNSRAKRIHFLIGTGWSTGTGTVIARLIIHYSDNTTATREIKYGEDLLDWWTDPPIADKVAFHFPNKAAGHDTYEYILSWDNPSPAKTITTIDFVSAETGCVPRLDAITLETY
jgi:hypothetical protein